MNIEVFTVFTVISLGFYEYLYLNGYLYRKEYIMKLTIKITQSAARKVLQAVKGVSSIKIKGSDFNRILGSKPIGKRK